MAFPTASMDRGGGGRKTPVQLPNMAWLNPNAVLPALGCESLRCGQEEKRFARLRRHGVITRHENPLSEQNNAGAIFAEKPPSALAAGVRQRIRRGCRGAGRGLPRSLKPRPGPPARYHGETLKPAGILLYLKRRPPSRRSTRALCHEKTKRTLVRNEASDSVAKRT